MINRLNKCQIVYIKKKTKTAVVNVDIEARLRRPDVAPEVTMPVL